MFNFYKKLTTLEKLGILLFLIVILFQVISLNLQIKNNSSDKANDSNSLVLDPQELTEKVIPKDGTVLPVSWEDLGPKMIQDGVIDEQKFRSLFRRDLTSMEEQMLTGKVSEPVVLDSENSRFILDLLWAFGLANKNEILEQGEMSDPKYGGAEKFASTGGWTLAKDRGFNHYSKHSYVTLTSEQQKLVENVSEGIYRPCCGNSTHFLDCNHGMAMLGLLQLMAKNDMSEEEMYKVALKVNSYWFPQVYMDLAHYFNQQGTDWNDVDAKSVLGQQYSSAQGYQSVKKSLQNNPSINQGGGSCGA